MDNNSHPVRGYLYIATAALFWAASATMGKAAFTGRLVGEGAVSALDPLILSQARTTFSFLVLFPALLLIRGPRGVSLRAPDLGRCLLLGAVGLVGANYFYYLAIHQTTVATAIILQYTAPIWVLAYMVARRLQRATWQRVTAVAAAVSGSALAIGLGSGGEVKLNIIGVVAAHMAALSFAFYNIYGHNLLVQHDRWKVVVYSLAGASAFWILVNPPWAILAANYSPQQWAFLVVFAFSSMLIPFSFYFAGLQHLDATRAIVTSCLEPVFAVGIAAFYLHEWITALQTVGIVIVLLATIIVQWPERPAEADRSRAVG